MSYQLSDERRIGAPLALLADDDGEPTRGLTGLLEEAGYVVQREQSGDRVIQRAREVLPDVIVIASDLPDMSGIALCHALRTDARLQHKPPIFVALAQPATTEARLAALRAGASECIALPLDAEEVVVRAGAYVHARHDADRARADGLLDPNTGLYNRQGLVRRARELGSQAFREHGPLACVVLSFEPGPGGVGGDEITGPVRRGVHALQRSSRRSDVVGRLGPTEFAVLAPGTNAAGARSLAERLTISLEAAAPGMEGSGGALRVRYGYEAVANVGYTPIEPVDLLVRAAASARSG